MKNTFKKAVVAVAAVGMLALPGLQAAMADTIKIGAVATLEGAFTVPGTFIGVACVAVWRHG